jgi:hypothetical protein
VDLREISWKGLDWIHLAQNRLCSMELIIYLHCVTPKDVIMIDTNYVVVKRKIKTHIFNANEIADGNELSRGPLI